MITQPNVKMVISQDSRYSDIRWLISDNFELMNKLITWFEYRVIWLGYWYFTRSEEYELSKKETGEILQLLNDWWLRLKYSEMLLVCLSGRNVSAIAKNNQKSFFHSDTVLGKIFA